MYADIPVLCRYASALPALMAALAPAAAPGQRGARRVGSWGSRGTRCGRVRGVCPEPGHGLDGEDSERLQLYAVSTGESPANNAWDSELVTESVVYDCRTGEELPLDLVAAGRAEEVAQMNSFEGHAEVPSSKVRGRHIKAKWLDDLRRRADGTPFVRSRLVAMDFNLFARDDVAAGAPYLFVMRLILSLAYSKKPRGRRQV